MLGVELAVHSHHAQERDRGVQAPSGFEPFLAVKPLLGLDPIAPVRRDPAEVYDPMDPGRLNERVLRAGEGLGMGLVGRGEHPHRRA